MRQTSRSRQGSRLYCLLFTLVSTVVFATEPISAQRPAILVHGAATYYSLNGKLQDVGITNTAFKWGYHAGVGIDVQVGETAIMDTFLQPHLVYVCKGFSADFDDLGISGSGITDIHTLEVPFLFNLRFNVAAPVYFYTNAGPYIGMGLVSRQRLKRPLEGKQVVSGEKVDLFSVEKGFKRLELGLQIGAGMEFHGIMLGLGYQFGLLNQSRVPRQVFRSQGGIIEVGYRF